MHCMQGNTCSPWGFFLAAAASDTADATNVRETTCGSVRDEDATHREVR